MDSPCKDCKRRKPGCHNIDTCAKWREYTAANKARILKNLEYKEAIYQERIDHENHMRRKFNANRREKARH